MEPRSHSWFRLPFREWHLPHSIRPACMAAPQFVVCPRLSRAVLRSFCRTQPFWDMKCHVWLLDLLLRTCFQVFVHKLRTQVRVGVRAGRDPHVVQGEGGWVGWVEEDENKPKFWRLGMCRETTASKRKRWGREGGLDCLPARQGISRASAT